MKPRPPLLRTRWDLSRLTALALLCSSTAVQLSWAQEAETHAPNTADISQHGTQWWQSFGDPMLNRVVEQALQQNLDLRASQLRVQNASTVAQQQRAPRLPTLSWDSSFDLAPTSSLGFQQGGAAGGAPGGAELPETYWRGSSSLRAGYEVDLLGRRALQHKASLDEENVALANVDQAALSLVGSVVTTYFDLVSARARAQIVEQQIETATKLLGVTVGRFEDGRAQATDMLQQRQQLAATLTLRPQVQAQMRDSSQRLAVLLGHSPQTPLTTAERLPSLAERPVPLAANERLAARPDVRAAHLAVAAADKRERAAPGYFSPLLRVSANAGLQAIALNDVNHQFVWGAGATLSVPLFSGGGDLAATEQRRVQAQLARNELRRLELEAQRQLRSAHAAELEQRQILNASEHELKYSAQSYQALRDRYLVGEGDVNTLLVAFVAQRRAELNLITAQRNVVVARVRLQQAVAPGATPTRQQIAAKREVR